MDMLSYLIHESTEIINVYREFECLTWIFVHMNVQKLTYIFYKEEKTNTNTKEINNIRNWQKQSQKLDKEKLGVYWKIHENVDHLSRN